MTRACSTSLVLALGLLPACSTLFPRDLPEESPALADMEEPLALHEEPDDESERAALPAGSFTGIEVRDARTSLDDVEDEPQGVLVKRVVENSPADVVGVVVGDLLVEAVDAAGTAHALSWPSDWRRVELDAEPGSVLEVVIDRAGAERTVRLHVIPRIRLRKRRAAQRYREEDRVGVVLRTATEVEARRAGLARGGGAVVVGLSRASPWRAAGLEFGDLITSVGDARVAHPQVVLNAIRDAEEDATLELGVLHGGRLRTVETAVSRRAQEMREVSVPLLLHYERDRGSTELSLLLGLVHHRTTVAAWEWRLLWLFRFSGGDSDALTSADEETR